VLSTSPAGQARPAGEHLQIGPASIGEGSPVFVIAEIGVNHNGDVDVARALIDRAISAGADAVKFQMRSLPSLYANGGDPDDPAEDLGSQYVLGVLQRAKLDTADMEELCRYAQRRGITWLCTPWDRESLQSLAAFDLPALKVASADLTNHDLLAAMAATGKPLLVSTGMSTEDEILEAVALLQSRGARFALLHCVAAYPPRLEELNLRYLSHLRSIGGGCPVGYSGHERGWVAVLAAVALGASVVEKHLTLDRALPGVDHKISLLPEEFAEMVGAIRQIEKTLGGAGPRRINQGERINRTILGKALVAAREICPGDLITRECIAVRSPARGLPANRIHQLIGRRSNRPIVPGEFFCDADLGDRAPAARTYRFRRPWGVPVRYHDFVALSTACDPDFVEFHLGAKDLDQDPGRFLSGPYECGFVVHCPEQFTDDFVIDLASDDQAVRDRSLALLDRVLSLTRGLRSNFTGAPSAIVVANLGGFTQQHPVSRELRWNLYARVAEGLNHLDWTGVTLLAQTLPPFPWHFGGYRIGNVFTDASDTAQACERYGWRLCLDVAHTYMAAVEGRQSFEEACHRLAPFTSHLHLSDARGVDGEGLQIGDGEIAFDTLAPLLDREAPCASFIPEIWEGHWNGGQGFWIALERLETWFGSDKEGTHGLV
jgi:N-acetylneuraminate synthase